MINRIRKILRVSRWEIARTSGGINRRTLLVALVLLSVAGGVLGGGLAAGIVGLDVDRDVYRVGVDPGSPYADAVESHASLTPVSTDRTSPGETADIIVLEGGVIVASETQKGEAAAAEFREAVEAHNERLMAAEENSTAAFPLTVSLQYVSRSNGFGDDPTLGESIDDDGSSEADGATDAGTGPSDDESEREDENERENERAAATGGDDSDDAGEGLAVPSIGGGTFGADTVGSPGSITPPFPFVSLLLAFIFLVPMNFLIQAYGSSILDERTNRRGEPLLVTPLTPVDIVAGKTLPYVGVAVLITAFIAVVRGAVA